MNFGQLVSLYNGLMSMYLGIPFPEQLDDDVWIEKYKQLKWLYSNGLININSFPDLDKLQYNIDDIQTESDN